MSRSMKESRDKKTAEANLKSLEQQRAKLEAQFHSEISTLEAKNNPLTETLEDASITPRKSDIAIQIMALVWTVV